MSEISTLSLGDSSAARAGELFKRHQEEIYRKTDHLLARLMLFQWAGGILIAFLISPYTWSGQSSSIHIHIWSAIFLGGAISVFPIWMTLIWPGAAITRYVIAVAQMLMSGLLIDLTGGRIETHFHVFGSLVILSFYRDWRVLIPATAVVALDHFLRGIYWPYSVYGVLTASPWRSIEHAGWVVFEDVFLIISCLRSVREMRFIANRTAQLEASEGNFRQIFEEAPIGMAVVNLNQCFGQVNRRLADMLGYSIEELAQKDTHEITHREDLAADKQNTDSLLQGARRCSFEKRYICTDKRAIWTALTACLVRDEYGKPHHYVTMVEDISERKRAEAALQESRRQLEAALNANQLIMDNSQDVICTADDAGRFLTVNAACKQMWGYTESELIGRHYIDLVHPDDREKTKTASEDLEVTGNVTDFVNRYIRKDGTVVDVLWSAYWSKSDRVSFCVAHDVTQRTRDERALREAKEEADRANRAKSEFLSRMSHELRTPLNAILGFSQLLGRKTLTDAQREGIDHIANAGRHLLDLINEVLDISRIETGRIQLSLEPVRVSDVLAETVDLIRPLAHERNIELCAAAPVDSEWHVLGDRQRFKQVLLNLLSNGVKYTPMNGRVAVSVDLLGQDKIRVVVSDSGPGIAPKNLSRLFTPFDRLGAEQSGVQGTGLGLALSQRLTHAMGGTLGVDSDLGKGSTFWVALPRTNSPSQKISQFKAGGSRQHVETPVPSAKCTVLYIEDNFSNLTLIERIIAEQPGIELVTAMQGKLGLDLARRHEPDLILLDLHLPDMPGWEVLAHLKATAETRDIPTVILSADATARQIDRLLAAGAHTYLTKPLDVDRLINILEEANNGLNRAEKA
jgi:PAS domain S-box-containing protein